MNNFYSHTVEIESVLIELDRMDLTKEQKTHLSSLVDSIIHQTVLDIILSKLSEEDRVLFVNKLKDQAGDAQLWEFVSSKVENIDDEIKSAVKDLKKELHEDLKEAG